MKNIDSNSHLRGESVYIDDIPEPRGTLHGVVFDSPVAHGTIKSVNYEKAEALDGVVKIFTYKDIPGENQIGAIIQDEELFAEKEVHYMGQPVAFIVADSVATARKAKKLIEIDIEKKPVITTAKEAFEKKSFIMPARGFKLGDTASSWDKCAYVFEGEVESGGQEHLYIETQGSYAFPLENGNIKISSSTQGPTSVQKISSQVLGVSMHNIEIDVNRLGGGFGGKEDQATPWATMAALAAKKLKKPVKVVLSRHDDLRMTGKRHPYSSRYKIGLDKDFKIIAFEAEYFQNSGASADLSPAISERTLFHSTNAYFIPNVTTTVHACKTNLPPNTAFRGFGAPQGMFVIESAIARAAEELGVEAKVIQEKNLLTEGDEFPYGQIAQKVEAVPTWKAAHTKFNTEKLEKEVAEFNKTHKHLKKGIAYSPLCFGISFTNTMMNHARALVHIYQDGSIGISTGAVEMGQSVNTKMIQVAALTLSVNPDRIKVESTNTTRVANTSPTAASSGADMNGKAVEIACNTLSVRLKTVAAELCNVDFDKIELKDEKVFADGKETDINWEKLVTETFIRRINLSENGHYATPDIHFDKTKEKGHPFAYHVYGTAVTTVTVDTLRGTYEIDAVRVIHDFGKSMNSHIDNGQIEGAVMQGIGWVTMEEIAFAEDGRMLSDALSTYKVPDINFAPKKFEIIHHETEGHKNAILKSKAVGEPPFIYGIGTYFAIQNAVKAFKPDYKYKFDAPITPEKLLMSLY